MPVPTARVVLLSVSVAGVTLSKFCMAWPLLPTPFPPLPPHLCTTPVTKAPKAWRLAESCALQILTEVTCDKQVHAPRRQWGCSQGDGLMLASCFLLCSLKAFMYS